MCFPRFRGGAPRIRLPAPGIPGRSVAALRSARSSNAGGLCRAPALRRILRRVVAQTPRIGAGVLLLVVTAFAEIGPGFHRHNVPLGDAVLSYVLREASGPALVLIPGSFVDARDWVEVVTRLDPTLRLMIVELPGHGKSWPPSADGSVEQFARDVLRAVDHARFERFYVGGHSIGGMVAIESGGRWPGRVKGVVSVEGWTHHSVLQDAFLGQNENTLSAAQMARKAELRNPVMSRWSPQQRAEFAGIWRKWNGFEILQHTSLPVLELWGDRGRARPGLEKMKIPERSNIEVRWIAGASHFLPLERPAEVAQAIQEFIRRVESAEHAPGSHKSDGPALGSRAFTQQMDSPQRVRHPEILLADPGKLASPADLALTPGKTNTVFRAQAGEWQFNLHSYLGYHDGMFWAIWSSGRVDEDSSSQLIRYATSRDGHTWSEARVLADDPDGPDGPGRWIARGIFVLNGKLTALAAYLEGPRDTPQGRESWANLRLTRFEWTGERWRQAGVFLENCMNNYPPRLLADRLFMTCRDSYARMHTARADDPAGSRWTVQKLPGQPPVDKMSEPSWYVDPQRVAHLIFRDQGRSGFLYRSISKDGGKTWTVPVRTNYPDATSKNLTGRFSNGWYYLINNPDPKSRDPLAISFSKDGWRFANPMALRKGAPERRFAGRAKTPRSFQYPHALEKDGSLWVIYSTNKEDIEISQFHISDLGVLP